MPGRNMIGRHVIGRNAIDAALLLAALALAPDTAAAFDDAKYPDWKGQWTRFIVAGVGGQASHDQTKPGGYGQQAPLTPQYQAVLEESLADQAKGGLGNYPTARCLPASKRSRPSSYPSCRNRSPDL